MKTFVIDGYGAYINSDTNEGRGPDVLVGYFTHAADAKRAVKGKDGWGRDGRVKPVNETITICESYEDYEVLIAKNTKERALNKLSPEEKKILGLE